LKGKINFLQRAKTTATKIKVEFEEKENECRRFCEEKKGKKKKKKITTTKINLIFN
jgi:hypothetical protein